MATKMQEETYEKIMRLYDLAEGVIDAVEFDEEIQPKEAYVPVVEELIEQVEVSAEVLAQSYIMFVETGKKPNSSEQRKIEGAFIKLFAAIKKAKAQDIRINKGAH